MARETTPHVPVSGMEPDETAEWFDSLDDAVIRHGPDRVHELLKMLEARAAARGVKLPYSRTTPYINTIPAEEQPRFPGNREVERRIKSLVRWNALAMVVRANKYYEGIGGHISTYASAATLFEIGFNHFFHARTEDHPGDFVYFQGHASPGVYARAFLEGRLTEEDLQRFRRESPRETGLSSYPHPWLMPRFWEFPTVSMGLSPVMAIYQARFLRYLQNRGIVDTSRSRVWAFLGDGEMDEPESVGALTLAAREGLDNLIFVVNCNLQRLDGPVRGNGKIIQELEGLFRGAGWNCLKVIWGDKWDPLLSNDRNGLLVKRMGEVVDGQYQKYTVESGDYIRNDFFGASPELRAMVDHLSDEQLQKLNRGGHDPEKVYAAYKTAIEHEGKPTVILAKTIKGYGLGEAGEGRNISHQQKKLNEQEMRAFRRRFEIPLRDEEVDEAPFYKPDDDSPEMTYLHQRRQELGGYLPRRRPAPDAVDIPPLEEFDELLEGSEGRPSTTTMAFDRLLTRLLRNKQIGKRVVPIVPDEARTFGLDSLFKQCGIYSPQGQLYEPVDARQLLYYREAQDGQVLEEGITEAGSMSSFIAAGTSYASLNTTMIPFYIFYSMFGFQRVGDLIWAAGDSRAKGFLLGGTAGRTTLNGEGLQHQDGHSHLAASTVPNLQPYDPAFAYELAVIIHDGLRRMYVDNEEIFYYLTVYNEPYEQPPLPEGVNEGILQGLYKLQSAEGEGSEPRPQLFGSGPILRETQRAQQLLAEKFGIGSDVWSATSYTLLRRDALAAERWNRMHPQEEPRASYLERTLHGLDGPFIAASDSMKAVPDQIARWVPGPYYVLGTDGFGRSDTREALRAHFEIDAAHIAWATLVALAESCRFDPKQLPGAMQKLEIDPDKPNPAMA